MRIVLSLVVGVCLFCESSPSQKEFSRDDFVVGQVSIGGRIDPVLESMGRPAKIDTMDVFDAADFLVYCFDGLTVWVERSSHTISSFDISSQRFQTQRGLRVGDSTAKLTSKYGIGDREEQLNRLYDIYDVGFKDFTEIMLYEYDAAENDVLYMVFYIKQLKIVKIYMYQGLGC